MLRIALGCSHVDIFQALRLLLWIEYLGGKRLPITVVTTQLAAKTEFYPKLQSLLSEHFDDARLLVCRTQNEKGWPESATHIFGETLNYCAGDDMLWLEPDAVPLVKTWFTQLRDEYYSAGKPFMGRFIPAAKTHPDHMSGVAIYGHNWSSFCPDLNKIDPKGMRAWDVDRAPWILPHTHSTRLIQHKWVRHEKDRTIPSDLVGEETVLFHQDKHHTLIRQYCPEFFTSALTLQYIGDTSRDMTRYFLTDNARKTFTVGGRAIQFEPCTVLNGVHFGTLSAGVDSDQLGALLALVATGEAREIDKEDFDKYEVKKKSYGPPKNSFDLPNLTESLAPQKVSTVAPAEQAASSGKTAALEDVLKVSKPKGRK